MRFLHKKTGGIYLLLQEALLEADKTPVVIYQCTKTGQLWVRPKQEFYDGRFKMIEQGGSIN